MLGPSGSGKTTVLRMVAGFETPTEGRILLGDQDVTARPPFARDVNTVFQDYALFPHMSVLENVDYGLRVKKVPRDQRRTAHRAGARDGPARRVRRPPAAPALRRPAAAGGARAGAGQPPEGAAARRAARRPRPQAAPRDADRAQGDAARGRHHVRVRDPRPGGGADDERPDRGVPATVASSRSPRRSSSTSSRRPRSWPASWAPRTCSRAPSREQLLGDPGPVSIRPEKIRLLMPGDPAPSGADLCTAPGVVREVVYLGAATHSVVDLDAGGTAHRPAAEPGEPRRPGSSTAGASRSTLSLAARPRRLSRDPHTVHRGRGGPAAHRGDPMKKMTAIAVGASLLAARPGRVRHQRAAAATGGTSSGGRHVHRPRRTDEEVAGRRWRARSTSWPGPGTPRTARNDKTVDWVTPFEKKTGCQANVKYFGTSDEALNLMKTGEYDVVSASGDASLRLIASGDAAPVNTDLLKSYADIQPFLKDRAWNSVDGQMYGIPQGWGANLLMWRTDKVKPAPTGWDAVFEKDSPYAGKITAYDSPIYIADAALYLMNTQPDLGHQEPLRARPEAARRGGRAAQDSSGRRSRSTGRTTSRSSRRSPAATRVIGTTWQFIANLVEADKVPVEALVPERGLDRLVGHLDGQRAVEELQLRLRVDGLHRRPRGQRRSRPSTSVRRRPTPRPATSRRTRAFCDDLPRRRQGLRRQDLVLDHADQAVPRRPQGRQVHRLRPVDPGLDRDQGLSHGRRPASCTAAPGSGSGCCSRHRCCGWAWPTSGPWRRCS